MHAGLSLIGTLRQDSLQDAAEPVARAGLLQSQRVSKMVYVMGETLTVPKPGALAPPPFLPASLPCG